MKTVYDFVGGWLNGKSLSIEEVVPIMHSRSADRTIERAAGFLVPREELDCQPKVNGYLGPMWDGITYNGKYGRELSDEEKAHCQEPVAHIRYETQDVYDSMSQ